MTQLFAPLTSLPGVGELYQKKLAKLNITTVFDLLTLAPRGYENRDAPQKIATLSSGQKAQIKAQVIDARIITGRKRILSVMLEDETGALQLKFFRFYPSQSKQFMPGKTLLCFGEVRRFNGLLEMLHPEYHFAETEEEPLGPEIRPLYPLTEGLSQKRLQNYIHHALQILQRLPIEELELLPADHLPSLGLWSFRQALQFLHQPEGDLALLQKDVHPCQIRLSFEELLAHRLALSSAQRQAMMMPAPALPFPQKAVQDLLSSLPFTLTAGQLQAFAEISQDLKSQKPMQRLLQGDVGAGKTIVAFLSALVTLEAGYQVVLMAPTEILAEQLFQKAKIISPQVAFLGGKQSKAEKTQCYAQLESGEIRWVIGTHALIQGPVQFKNLGLIIIDEQHRFGVLQRLSLQHKNQNSLTPHQLIMSATPIPRTLAMTLYAELSISSIQELPKGRQPIKTALISELKRNEVITRLNEASGKGDQAYWICPLIEESEALDAEAAIATFLRLQKECPKLRIGLLHGRLKTEEKSTIMQQFKSGKLDVLVATTVVEVGVDVPNASIMVIENPERMGLSQLHQLRGRVGRGHKESACILLYQAPLSATAQARLTALRDSQDGFYLAEKDLELRGPGEFLGTRQKGSVHFRFASLMRDQHLLPQIKMLADRMLLEHPEQAQKLITRWFGSQSQFIRA